MPPLPTQLRNRLETAVKQARRTAESAAKVALERLTVGGAEPGSHLSVDERQLRNRLRAHGRQLGDQRDPKTGTQSISRLLHECAYEHWHRMLFARFLAENHLLIHDKEGMPVTLAECDELARDESADDADGHRSGDGVTSNLRKSVKSADDGWSLAGRFASRMLPQIFRPDDPVLQVSFAPEHKRALEKLVTELPVEVFTAEDSLGWVYQFWQAERKDEVNKSGDKITGETLPAVTQLFTEHYMVLFLLHNTIGAWWAARVKAEGKRLKAEWDACQSEEDCRKLVALPGYDFTYLRFIREEPPEQENGGKEAQDTQEAEGQDTSAFSLQPSTFPWRPAAGGFPGWPKSLKEFKLLDPCCGSGHFLVAAFDLLVRLRMVNEGLSARGACDAVLRDNLHGLEIDPRCTQIAAFALALTAWKFPNLSADDADDRRFGEKEKQNLCKSAQSAEALGFRPLPPVNIACSGLGVNARKEDWLALANGDTRLRSGLEILYDLFQKAPELGSLINPRRLAHGDLVTASFAEIQPILTRALQSEKAKRNEELNEIGVAAQGMAQAARILATQYDLVTTNVPYLGFKKQGEIIQVFAEHYAEDAKHDLATVSVQRCVDFSRPDGVTALVTPQNWLFLGSYKRLRVRLLKSLEWLWVTRLGPGAFETISGEVVNVVLLSLRRTPPDKHHHLWGCDATEGHSANEKAAKLGQTPLDQVAQTTQLANPDARIALETAGKGVLMSKQAQSLVGIQTGDYPRFAHCFWEVCLDGRTWEPYQRPPHVTGDRGCTEAILWERGRGALYRFVCEKLGPDGTAAWLRGGEAWGKKGVAISLLGDLMAVPYFGVKYDQTLAVILPESDLTLTPLWTFCSDPEFSRAVRRIDQKMNVTSATLVKVPFDLTHWQREALEKYPRGLPEPNSDDPTQWLFDGRLADSTAPLQVGVARLLGYRWPRQTGQTVSGAPPVPDDGLDKLADEDGIVCIPSVRGEVPAAERLRATLAAAYGKAWSSGKMDELLSAVDYAGSNLEDWLRNGFFDQHCKLFHQRPFIWQISDGRKDGFSALVNYHKLDHKLLEKLTYTYLGDWIKKQQEAVANEESGADDRLLKAHQLQDKLKLILEGEKPYDIFVRWKPLEQQPIGWHPDLNDGVRLNIRPFVIAGVLRKTPKIKWSIDRGKNPPGSPWGEVRDNDRHLALEDKQRARREA